MIGSGSIFNTIPDRSKSFSPLFEFPEWAGNGSPEGNLADKEGDMGVHWKIPDRRPNLDKETDCCYSNLALISLEC
jgi:hypothetical protein